MSDPALCLPLFTLCCQCLFVPPAPSERLSEVDIEPRAQPLDTSSDGIYGRFAGDLDFGLGLGSSHVDGSNALALRTSLHYFSTAGVWLSGDVPFDESADDDSASVAFGVDLRPAFLPRFSENMQQGPARLDLMLDAISLSLGPYFKLAPSAAESDLGLELSLGSGVPLSTSAEGLWVEARALGRFPDGREPTEFGALLVLAWHTWFRSPLVE